MHQWKNLVPVLPRELLFDAIKLHTDAHPFTNWFLCSFLSKQRHHSQNITPFSWSYFSHSCPSAHSLLKRLIFEGGTVGFLVLEASTCVISLSNRAVGEWEVMANCFTTQTARLDSDIMQADASSSKKPHIRVLKPAWLFIAENGGRKQKVSR